MTSQFTSTFTTTVSAHLAPAAQIACATTSVSVPSCTAVTVRSLPPEIQSPPAQIPAIAAIATVAIACHFKTRRIGLVESGASITAPLVVRANPFLRISIERAPGQRSKPIDFTSVRHVPATK